MSTLNKQLVGEHGKGSSVFFPREKWGEPPKKERGRRGRGTKENACTQTPPFENPVRQRKGLVIG